MSGDRLAHTSLRQRARDGVANVHVRHAVRSVTSQLAIRRDLAEAQLANYEELRDTARAMRTEIVSRLPELLERLADGVEANGGTVHWAADAAEARDTVTAIAREHGARVAVKSKSMLTEEIGLNDALAGAGVDVVETDLGEWIIQLAGEEPSHILAPAIHKTRQDVAELFRRVAAGDLSDLPEELTAFARARLRERFLEADLGITGVNFGVAESGTLVLVTNEGNARMVTSLPPVHVAVMGMERIVETFAQLDTLLALLPRAAVGQDISVYVNHLTGPRRDGETDGPDEQHLVIVDNGRSALIGGEYQEMLNCIRCGSCLNVCPVYRQVGGHAYGWVYSGPMGAVLTPLLHGGGSMATPDPVSPAFELADATSLCGACHDACPVGIPLQDLLLGLRRERAAVAPAGQRAAWSAWARAWSSPGVYRATARLAASMGRVIPEGLVPDAWTQGRAVPRPPAGGDFRSRFERGEC